MIVALFIAPDFGFAQVNNAERGFSVLANGPLDMRMDPQVRAVGRSRVFISE